MKRIIIIVEGQTEEEFVNQSLRPYFEKKGILGGVSAIKIQTSKGHKGGFVNYDHLKRDLQKVLKEPGVVVSTFVDFFRLPTNLPGFGEIGHFSNADSKIVHLQQAMAKDINHDAFIPYIQKFEFEALLFSSNAGFEQMYDKPAIHRATGTIVAQYENPEEINDNPNTAPSKRLEKILSDQGEKYSKVVEGSLIAQGIGMETILERCPRFRHWVGLLEAAAK